MEVILELLFEFFGELILQLVLELLFELGLRSVKAPFAKSPHPFFGGVGYALFGAVAGGLSLWWFPTLFLRSHVGQVTNAILTPLLSGAAMAALGRWRRRREQTTILLDRFAYAFIFALAMALVRIRFGA